MEPSTETVVRHNELFQFFYKKVDNLRIDNEFLFD